MWGGALGVAAACLQVAGYLLYIRNFRVDAIRPNAASFYMFAYGTAFVFLLEWHHGATLPVLMLPGACALMSIVIALMCMRRGATEPVDRVEWATFGIDVALTIAYGLTLYAFGQNPALALFFLLGLNATSLTAFFPLLRSTYRFPKRERPGPWMVWTGAYALLTAATLAETGTTSPALLVYPLLNLGLHAALVALSLRREGPGNSFRDGSGKHVYNRPSGIHGLGMFAGRNYAMGEEIWVLKGRPVANSGAEANPNAVGFAQNFWIDPDPPFEFVNHSCDPNAAFGRDGQFYALRPITKDEEVVMDYSTTEADPEWRMACGCGSSKCRQELRAIQIAFSESLFPPPASPGLQMVWRTQRLPAGAESRPAFPQLSGSDEGQFEVAASSAREPAAS
jgi:hypothetical protein